jgi:methylmalonyl-CoA/ethylmalonyl-CoA epimerase
MFKLDHVAVAVRDLERSVEGFESKQGLHLERVEVVPTEKAKVAFFDIGGAHLELVASMDPSSAIARSLDKRGEGLHHICLEVKDIESALTLARAAGLPLVNETPVPGAGGSRVAFVHPKGLSGVLIELVEKPKKT